jgi:hypothetical protein
MLRNSPGFIKPFVYGEIIRDYSIEEELCGLAPYDNNFETVEYKYTEPWGKHLWCYRTPLEGVVSFGGKTRLQLGDKWWGWYRWIPEKYRCNLSIAYAEVATHNHFALDRGGKVFKQTAPVIKLPGDASEDDHLALLGLLNSSTACFWMKQVCFPKKGYRDSKWEERIAFNATNVGDFPLPVDRLLKLSSRLDALAQRLAEWSPAATPTRQRAAAGDQPADVAWSLKSLSAAREQWETIRGRMIALQEELDWRCYSLYGLIDDDLTYGKEPSPIQLGQRAFEIVMARKMAAGELETTWFERHGSTPTTEIPTEWPDNTNSSSSGGLK